MNRKYDSPRIFIDIILGSLKKLGLPTQPSTLDIELDVFHLRPAAVTSFLSLFLQKTSDMEK